MSDPLIEASDLAAYLNDDKINVARAEIIIAQAQALCESIVSPLPAVASAIVLRMAVRGYREGPQSRQRQTQAAGSPFGGYADLGLTREDRADLRRLSSRGGAGAVSMFPASYAPSLPSWDMDAGATDVATS